VGHRLTPTDAPDASPVLTLAQLARLLGVVDRRAVVGWCERNGVPVVRLGARGSPLRVPRGAAEEALGPLLPRDTS